MLHIKVILGSTRNGRFGEQPARWIMDLAAQHPDAAFELIDLAEVNLPFVHEATPPGLIKDGEYESESSKQWAKIVNDADGFVIVTAEYNHGVPAALKNALDTLFAEWNYKPVAFVSYGTIAGGVRAVEQLRGTLALLKLYGLSEQVVIPNYWSQLNDKGTFQPNETQIKDAHRLLKSVIFWSSTFKEARKKLAAHNS